MNRHYPREMLCRWVAAVALAVLAGASGAAEFVAGADMSRLVALEAANKEFKDDGVTTDALRILKRRGVRNVRLRLWTSSPQQANQDPYNYGNNLDYTLPLAARVKNAGMQLTLDFHYSDTWADPGHQAKPAAWANLNFTQLVQRMRDYNRDCIAAFIAAGAMPDYVQVGNEITTGLLFPDGYVGGSSDTPAQWSKLAQLLNAAVQGIADATAAAGRSMPGIIVHIDRGGDWDATRWYFDNLTARGVPFDIIGQSYYPFWHGPLSALQSCLNQTATRYGKPVMLMETAFPWTNTHWTAPGYIGIPPTVAGQLAYVQALAPVVKSVTGGLGAGVFWWGAEYQDMPGTNEAGFDTTSFFDAGGNVLPAVEAFGQLTSSKLPHVSLPFDEAGGPTAVDSSGHGWDATLLNGPAWVEGRVNNAVSVGASDHSVSLPAGVVSHVNGFTLSVWVKLNSVTSGSRILDFGTDPGNTMYLTPNDSSSGKVRFAIQSTTVAEQVIDGAAPLPGGVWTHVAVTGSGSTGKLYVNGATVGTNHAMTLKPYHLGTTTWNHIGKPSLDGLVDEFRIDDHARSPNEVISLATPITPEELRNVAITLSGSIATTTLGPSLVGRTYQLQWRDDLATGSWKNHGASRTGSGGVLQFPGPAQSPRSRRFFRIDVHQ